MTGAQNLSQYELKILANIEEFGCHVTTVFDPESNDPSFTYSTGFPETLEQGEVIVFGLDHELMGFIVNETMRLSRKGLKLNDGLAISDLVEGFDLVARAIPPANILASRFNSAMWWHRHKYGSDLAKAFQLVWPSTTTGLFPWDSGCHSSVIEAQPALYESRLNS